MGIGVKTMFWSPLLTSTSKLYSLWGKIGGGHMLPVAQVPMRMHWC